MIPGRLHAALDAVSAATLITAAAVATGSPIRRPLGAIGMAVAGYSVATSYGGDPSSTKPFHMSGHRLLDAAQGGACLALAAEIKNPWMRNLLRGYGAFSLAVAALSAPPGPAGVDVPQDAVSSAGELGPDVAYLRCGIVNVVFIGAAGAGDREWFLVDAGLPGSAAAIEAAARRRFGSSRPAAILLTHGHFDHVGALEHLAQEWDAPIYAHPLEHPYLTGKQAYPPAAPEVGGGLMAELSWLFPKQPIDVSGRLHALPPDGSIPGLPGWQWIHTPGHSPGHVSLLNITSRTLVAGDAIVTTRQESLFSALLSPGHLQGPPAYFTTDWTAALDSVQHLAELAPQSIVSGHGPPLHGPAMRIALQELASDFRQKGLPTVSRYLRTMA